MVTDENLRFFGSLLPRLKLLSFQSFSTSSVAELYQISSEVLILEVIDVHGGNLTKTSWLSQRQFIRLHPLARR
eukprot:749748-Hanusia_phi.AAC.3